MKKYFNIFSQVAVTLTLSSNAFADAQLDLFRAARADNPSGVKGLIERGVNPNLRDEHGQTALLVAMREPSPRVIDVMVASPKVDVDATLALFPSLSNWGRVRLESDVSISREVVKDLTLGLNGVESYDNQPPEGSDMNDWNIYLSLGWSF